MVGYISSGLMDQNTGTPHFNDRSYLNPLEWKLLWKLMNDYVDRFGNQYPCETNAEIREALDSYRKAFRELKESYFYKFFRSHINAVALIDSNVERCDALRARRGEGSDVERSQWKFYTPLQNLMYKELYPDCYIDIAWFDDYNTSDVVKSIAYWLTDMLVKVASNMKVNAPHIEFKLPVPKQDLNLNNVSTHVYRSKGRVEVKNLMNQDACKDNDVPETVSLKSYAPKYLNVYDRTTTPTKRSRLSWSSSIERIEKLLLAATSINPTQPPCKKFKSDSEVTEDPIKYVELDNMFDDDL